jgi:hypothetical protein
MTAQYPGSTVTFTPKVNLTDVVVANDINRAYEEISAIASTVGGNPQIRSASWGVGSYSTSTLNFTTLNDRILNVENGTYISYTDTPSLTVRNSTTGNTITPSSTTAVNLTLKAVASQSVNVFETKNAAGTDTLVSINAAGTLKAVLIDGGSA